MQLPRSSLHPETVDNVPTHTNSSFTLQQSALSTGSYTAANICPTPHSTPTTVAHLMWFYVMLCPHTRDMSCHIKSHGIMSLHTVIILWHLILWQNILWNYVMSCHNGMLCHTISCCAMLCNLMPCIVFYGSVTPCHVMQYNVMLYHLMSSSVLSHHITSRHIMLLHFVMLCLVNMLNYIVIFCHSMFFCYVILCFPLLCFVTFFCVTLCHVTSHHNKV